MNALWRELKENRYVLIDRYSTWKHILYAVSDSGAPELQDHCFLKTGQGRGFVWSGCDAQLTPEVQS